MKMKITDLLDCYHDTSVKFSTSRDEFQQKEPVPITTAKKSGMKRPLTAVACLILLFCGTALIGLRFLGGNEGASLAQSETESAAFGSEIQEESLDTIGYESVTEPEEIQEATTEDTMSDTPEEPETPEASPEDEPPIYTSEEAYLAELIMYDSNDETCTPITHFTTGQNVTVSFTLNWPDTEDEKTVAVTYRLLDENKTEIATYASEQTIPGSWTETLLSSDLPGLTSTPGSYALEVYLEDDLLAVNSFYVSDPDTHYDPAQDTDGDGYLTAWLTYDTPNGTIVKLQLDVTENTCAWYLHNEEAFDAYVAWETGTGDWDTFDQLHTTLCNDLLEQYFKNAYIVFTDGTKMPLATGDSVRIEDDLIREEYVAQLTNATEDYTPAYLEFNGVRYDFE